MRPPQLTVNHPAPRKKRASNAQVTLAETGRLVPLEPGGVSKTNLDYWLERVFKPTYSRDGKTIESPNWAVEIQHRGKRHKWSLGTANKAAAAARAKEIYLFVAANGWGEAFD